MNLAVIDHCKRLYANKMDSLENMDPVSESAISQAWMRQKLKVRTYQSPSTDTETVWSSYGPGGNADFCSQSRAQPHGCLAGELGNGVQSCPREEGELKGYSEGHASVLWVSLRREVLEDTGDSTEPHMLSTLPSVWCRCVSAEYSPGKNGQENQWLNKWSCDIMVKTMDTTSHHWVLLLLLLLSRFSCVWLYATP